MENFVPATGRVLRYWYCALSDRCRHQLYDYLGVRPIESEKGFGEPAATLWVNSEIWSRPDPGHERTVVISDAAPGSQIPVLKKRVRMSTPNLALPSARRPGVVIRSTFRCASRRLGRARSSLPGISVI